MSASPEPSEADTAGSAAGAHHVTEPPASADHAEPRAAAPAGPASAQPRPGQPAGRFVPPTLRLRIEENRPSSTPLAPQTTARPVIAPRPAAPAAAPPRPAARPAAPGARPGAPDGGASRHGAAVRRASPVSARGSARRSTAAAVAPGASGNARRAWSRSPRHAAAAWRDVLANASRWWPSRVAGLVRPVHAAIRRATRVRRCRSPRSGRRRFHARSRWQRG